MHDAIAHSHLVILNTRLKKGQRRLVLLLAFDFVHSTGHFLSFCRALVKIGVASMLRRGVLEQFLWGDVSI